MPAPFESATADKYREQRPPCDRELGSELAHISADIVDPVLKLKYLRGAIEDRVEYERSVQQVPIAQVRRALYRLRGLEALDPVAHDAAARASIRAQTLVARTRARRLVAGTLAAGLLFMPALFAGVALTLEPKRSVAVATAPPLPSSGAMAPVAPSVTTPAELPTPVEQIDVDSLGMQPSTIWLADRGKDWELYSNGLRIETAFTVKADARNYRVHDRTGVLQPTAYTRPVGILFHTSESDLWPLEADFGKELRRSSTALLRFVRSSRAYNYVIDRFGRVYRIVDDESRASHAGHAVWAHGDEVYLDLNSAFVGVSFESRWEGGKTLPITRAQLVAGRNLTNYLRQRFAIAPEMCVTHGLTSVSPKPHLIGYHRDWARGFPFAAFGLPDLYTQPPPSVTLFGFGYDEEYLRTVGRWPGLIAADALLAAEAREKSVSVAALRAERRAAYQHWVKQLRGKNTGAVEIPAQQANTRG
jgi:N-acetylmuramoyl-L-alanine amidase